jgi:hypothetical protein
LSPPAGTSASDLELNVAASFSHLLDACRAALDQPKAHRLAVDGERHFGLGTATSRNSRSCGRAAPWRKSGASPPIIWSSFREGTVVLRKQGFGGSTAKE